ncbi:MAG: nitrate/nitrite transporter NrtS [Bacteroidales bacterium]|nr:nitrate/nitrite transporter NrtS [Bacteroidales bacterium]
MTLKKVLTTIINKSIIKDALLVSLVVGSILNIVNQGDLLFRLEFSKISIPKLILTFIVPYLVSTYASVKTKLSFNPEEECKNSQS